MEMEMFGGAKYRFRDSQSGVVRDVVAFGEIFAPGQGEAVAQAQPSLTWPPA